MSPEMAFSRLSKQGGARPLRPDNSDVNLFSYCERVIDLDPEISDGALDFRAAQQKLNGAHVTRASVDEGRLCST